MKYKSLILAIVIVAAALAPLFNAQPVHADSLSTDLVAYWKLDEESGTRLDSFGGHDLSDNNGVGNELTDALIGRAASFSAASSQYLSTADTTDLSASGADLGDMTFTAWARLADKSAYRYIISKSATTEYYIDYNPSQDRFRFGWGDNYVWADALGSPSVDTWYFIVGWYDSVGNTVNIEINGLSDSANAGAFDPSGNGSFLIGWQGTQGYYMDGLIDEVGVWRRMLTSDERAQLYNDGAGLDFDMFGLVPVWQIGTYLKNGDFETTSLPWLTDDWLLGWHTANTATSTKTSWTPGNYQPLCSDRFRQLDVRFDGGTYQSFIWYGGDMYVSIGARVGPDVALDIVIYDPFGDAHYIAADETETGSQWQMFNDVLFDMPVGHYTFFVLVSGFGKVGLDCAVVSEGDYQLFPFNETPLDPPVPIATSFSEQSILATESTEPLQPNWWLSEKAAELGGGDITDKILEILPGAPNAIAPDVIPARSTAKSKNWIEVTDAGISPFGFDPLGAYNTFANSVTVSFISPFMGVASLIRFEKIEGGDLNIITKPAGDSDLIIITEPSVDGVDPETGWWHFTSDTPLDPGKYRVVIDGSQQLDDLMLAKVCVRATGLAYTICENESSPPISVPATATLGAVYGFATSNANTTSTQQVVATQTAVARSNATSTARVAATQTALVGANSTVIALATRAQATLNATSTRAAATQTAVAATATKAHILTATAFVSGNRATLTQRVALTQTKIAANAATQSVRTTATAAMATQRAHLTQTAAVQQTVAAQPNIYATLTAAALATAQRQGELATNAAIMTQQYYAQQTAIAQMTAVTNGTSEAQATAIAELNATIAALATAQAAATAVTNPTALPATAVVVSMPPEQPLTTWDVECIRPTNPLNLAWWVDYERCMILSWFAWGPSNTAQIQDLQTNVGGREPFGTILQIGDAFGNLRDSFGIFDWGLTGATCSTAPPNATIFFEQARGILAGELDLNEAYSTYSDEGNMPIDVIVGPYIARGIHFFLNMLCALGIMQWFQWMADVVFVFLIIFYFKTRWIDPTFS